MNKGIAEHTARFDIAALRTFGMEKMLEELLKLRAKEKK